MHVLDLFNDKDRDFLNGGSAVTEGGMPDLNLEYQDYLKLPPMAFQSRYKMSKESWAEKYKNLLPKSTASVNPTAGMAEAGFPGAPDVEMPPMQPSGDPQRDKLKQEYVDLHREIKSLVDIPYRSDSSPEQKMQAKARIKQLNDRADQIKAILEPRQPPNEWQKKTYGYDDNWNRVGKDVLSGLNEFATGGANSGDGGNYFKALAMAWYNGVFDSGSLGKGIKTQQDVERLLQRGVVAPDGKTRKYHIDYYDSNYLKVVIFSNDFYEYGDNDGIDTRSGKPFGPYDYMEFTDSELKESVTEAVEDRTSYQVAKILAAKGIKYEASKEDKLIGAIGTIMIRELGMNPKTVKNIIRHDKDFLADTLSELHHMTPGLEESEGSPEGVPHVTKELLQHIVQQVDKEGAHAIVKSLEWGDGAADELLDMIVTDLKHRINTDLDEEWSQKYKNSINCSHPKGFSQRAHCAGKKKHNESAMMEMTCPDCGMCKTHGNVMEIKKGQKDANGYTRCWPGKHAEGTKKGKNGGQVRNCKPNESVSEDTKQKPRIRKYSKMRPDGSKMVRYEVLDYMGRRITGQGSEGFDDLKNAKNFYHKNYDRLVSMDEDLSSNTTPANKPEDTKETMVKETGGRYWCSTDKRWKDR
jgi:hypothetical protein